MSTDQSLQLSINNLLGLYKSRQYDLAQNLALTLTKDFPNHNLSWKVLGSIYVKIGQIDDALISIQKAVKLDTKDAEAHSNMGLILFQLNMFEKAIRSFKKAINLKANYAEAYNNLGIVLQKINKLEQAEFNYKKAIVLKPKFEAAHNNLGNTLRELSKFKEAEKIYLRVIFLYLNFIEAHYNLGITQQKLNKLIDAESSFKKVIELKPNYFEAYNNLGIILQTLGKLKEAEKNYKKAINLKVDYADAYNNLGITLQRLNRLDEAEFNYREAIKFKPKFEIAYNNLGNVLKDLGKLEEAEKNYKKAIEINPGYTVTSDNLDTLYREKKLLKKIQNEKFNDDIKSKNSISKIELTINPFIVNRSVEPNLLSTLYKIKSTDLSKTEGGPLFGIGRTTHYQLFKHDFYILQSVEKDLIHIMVRSVNSDIYVMESFFNILKAKSGSIPHNHISSFDRIKGLVKKKFSLVYYLSVGDQNSVEPGTFKLNDPDEEILPCNGMVIIIPADRKHSAIYDGKTDRVMIGINFYSII